MTKNFVLLSVVVSVSLLASACGKENVRINGAPANAIVNPANTAQASNGTTAVATATVTIDSTTQDATNFANTSTSTTPSLTLNQQGTYLSAYVFCTPDCMDPQNPTYCSALQSACTNQATGCTTGYQTFTDATTACDTLFNDSANNNCAFSDRLKLYDEYCTSSADLTLSL